VACVCPFHDGNLAVADIKPENFQVKPHPLTVTLVDLDGVHNLSSGTTPSSATFTSGYIAREVVNNPSYTLAMDLFSLGAVLADIFSPYDSKNELIGLGQLYSNGRDFLAHSYAPDSFEARVQSICQKMTDTNPDTRPSALTVLTELKKIQADLLAHFENKMTSINDIASLVRVYEQFISVGLICSPGDVASNELSEDYLLQFQKIFVKQIFESLRNESVTHEQSGSQSNGFNMNDRLAEIKQNAVDGGYIKGYQQFLDHTKFEATLETKQRPTAVVAIHSNHAQNPSTTPHNNNASFSHQIMDAAETTLAFRV